MAPVHDTKQPPTRSRTALSLLSGFRLVHEGVPLTLPVHAQRLLAFVALSKHATRLLTAGTLWPEVREERALGNLRSTLWRVQRICPTIIVSSRSALALSPSVTLDVHECHATVLRLSKKPDDSRVADLTRGPLCEELLPGWYDDWVLKERDRLHHLRLRALEEAADLLLGRGFYDEAMDAASAAARSDPLRESARRLILRIHVAEGNHVEALRHFRSFRNLLVAELGIEPSPRTWALLSEPG